MPRLRRFCPATIAAPQAAFDYRLLGIKDGLSLITLYQFCLYDAYSRFQFLFQEIIFI